MQGIEFGDEVISVTVAIGRSLKRADLIVNAFETAGGDGKIVPVQNAGAMSFQCVGHRLHDLNAPRP